MIKNYIRKIVKKVLDEEGGRKLEFPGDQLEILVREILVPGIRSMLHDQFQKIDNALEVAKYANQVSSATRSRLDFIENGVNELRHKLEGEVGKEVLKRLLS